MPEAAVDAQISVVLNLQRRLRSGMNQALLELEAANRRRLKMPSEWAVLAKKLEFALELENMAEAELARLRQLKAAELCPYEVCDVLQVFVDGQPTRRVVVTGVEWDRKDIYHLRIMELTVHGRLTGRQKYSHLLCPQPRAGFHVEKLAHPLDPDVRRKLERGSV